MRTMTIPPFERTIEIADFDFFVRSRLAQAVVIWPEQAIPLVGYMAWPNQPELRAELVAALRGWFEGSRAAAAPNSDRLGTCRRHFQPTLRFDRGRSPAAPWRPKHRQGNLNCRCAHPSEGRPCCKPVAGLAGIQGRRAPCHCRDHHHRRCPRKSEGQADRRVWASRPPTAAASYHDADAGFRAIGCALVAGVWIKKHPAVS